MRMRRRLLEAPRIADEELDAVRPEPLGFRERVVARDVRTNERRHRGTHAGRQPPRATVGMFAPVSA